MATKVAVETVVEESGEQESSPVAEEEIDRREAEPAEPAGGERAEAAVCERAEKLKKQEEHALKLLHWLQEEAMLCTPCSVNGNDSINSSGEYSEEGDAEHEEESPDDINVDADETDQEASNNSNTLEKSAYNEVEAFLWQQSLGPIRESAKETYS